MIDKRAVAVAVRLLDQHLGSGVTDHAMQKGGLSRADLTSAPGFVPLSAEFKMIEAAARKVGERHLGLKFGMAQNYSDLGPYADYVQNAPNLFSAIARGGLGLSFVQPGGRVRLRTEQAHTILSYDYGLPTLNGVHHAQEAMPYLLRDLVRSFIGPDWQPDWIEIPGAHPPDYGSFGLPVPVHGNADLPGIAFPSQILKVPNPRKLCPTPDLADLPRLTGLDRPNGLADRVRAVLSLQASQGDLSVEANADYLGLGVRSLERQLQQEDTSFRDIKQAFLHERACQMLTQPGNKPNDVADALGYREPNSFRRAFRNWTGQTPAAFAAQHRATEAL